MYYPFWFSFSIIVINSIEYLILYEKNFKTTLVKLSSCGKSCLKDAPRNKRDKEQTIRLMKLE